MLFHLFDVANNDSATTASGCVVDSFFVTYLWGSAALHLSTQVKVRCHQTIQAARWQWCRPSQVLPTPACHMTPLSPDPPTPQSASSPAWARLNQLKCLCLASVTSLAMSVMWANKRAIKALQNKWLFPNTLIISSHQDAFTRLLNLSFAYSWLNATGLILVCSINNGNCKGKPVNIFAHTDKGIDFNSNTALTWLQHWDFSPQRTPSASCQPAWQLVGMHWPTDLYLLPTPWAPCDKDRKSFLKVATIATQS